MTAVHMFFWGLIQASAVLGSVDKLAPGNSGAVPIALPPADEGLVEINEEPADPVAEPTEETTPAPDAAKEKETADAATAAVADVLATAPLPPPPPDHTQILKTRAWEGVPIEVLDIDTAWTGFNESLMTKLRKNRYVLPFGTDGSEPAMESNGTWNGAYFSNAPSPVQQEEKKEESFSKITSDKDNVAERLNHWLLQLGDEDLTPYYVDEAPTAIGMPPSKRFLTKKEVNTMFKWTVNRLDKLRKDMLLHANAVDPAMFSLNIFKRKLADAQRDAHKNLDDFKKDAEERMKGVDAKVHETVMRSYKAHAFTLWNATGPEWVMEANKQVSRANQTLMTKLRGATMFMEHQQHTMETIFGDIKHDYDRWGTKATAEMMKWLATYEANAMGVVARLRQQLDLNHQDTSTWMQGMSRRENYEWVKWFKNFMVAYRSGEAKTEFYKVFTQNLIKYSKKLRIKLMHEQKDMSLRVDVWNKINREQYEQLLKDVSNYHHDMNVEVGREIRDASSLVNAGNEKSLQALKRGELVEYNNSATLFNKYVDYHGLFNKVMAFRAGMRRDVKDLQNTIDGFPDLQKMNVKINRMMVGPNALLDEITKLDIEPAQARDLRKLALMKKNALHKMDAATSESSLQITTMYNQVAMHLDSVKGQIADAWQAEMMAHVSGLSFGDDGVPAAAPDDLGGLSSALTEVKSAIENIQSKGTELKEQARSAVESWQSGVDHLSTRHADSLMQLAAPAVLHEWQQAVHSNLEKLSHEISTIHLHAPHIYNPNSLTEIPEADENMWKQVEEATRYEKKFPHQLRTEGNHDRKQMREIVMASIQRAVHKFSRFAKHAEQLALSSRTIQHAKDWLRHARLALPKELDLHETEDAVDRLEEALDKSETDCAELGLEVDDVGAKQAEVESNVEHNIHKEKSTTKHDLDALSRLVESELASALSRDSTPDHLHIPFASGAIPSSAQLLAIARQQIGGELTRAEGEASNLAMEVSAAGSTQVWQAGTAALGQWADGASTKTAQALEASHDVMMKAVAEGQAVLAKKMRQANAAIEALPEMPELSTELPRIRNPSLQPALRAVSQLRRAGEQETKVLYAEEVQEHALTAAEKLPLMAAEKRAELHAEAQQKGTQKAHRVLAQMRAVSQVVAKSLEAREANEAFKANTDIKGIRNNAKDTVLAAEQAIQTSDNRVQQQVAALLGRVSSLSDAQQDIAVDDKNEALEEERMDAEIRNAMASVER